MTADRYSLDDLLRVMQRLRDPKSGCPWDLRQDFRSIVPSTLEECYELAQAIEQEDYPHVAEELGDVLFQVVFYAQLGRERGLFTFGEIVSTLVEKLLRRHPHVFADGDIEGVAAGSASLEEVGHNWEAIKAAERAGRSQTDALSDVPVTLPALPRAQKVQKRAAQGNFDWSEVSAVLAKVEEEIAELRVAIEAGDPLAMEWELGDLLFSGVNVARHLGIDAEASLRRATARFESRFRSMEAAAGRRNVSLGDLDQEQLDELWEQAKHEHGG